MSERGLLSLDVCRLHNTAGRGVSVVRSIGSKERLSSRQYGDNRNDMLAFAGKHSQTDMTAVLVLWQHADQHAHLALQMYFGNPHDDFTAS